MPESPENKKNGKTSSKGPGWISRSRSWWRGWLESWQRLAGRLYDWWHPPSGHHGKGYGYGGLPPSRPVRAWYRLRSWLDHSILGRGYRALGTVFLNWWYPPTKPHAGESYGYGDVPKSRPVRAWHRLRRWLKRSTLGRGYRALGTIVLNWWYPPSKPTAEGYYGYGDMPRSRPIRAWHHLGRQLKNSALGRAYRRVSAAFLNWWYPPPDQRSGGYYGYGYGSEPLSRPVRAWHRLRRWLRNSALGRFYRTLAAKFLNWWYPSPDDPGERSVNRLTHTVRRLDRWFRKTWLGRKLAWVLDDAAELYEGFRVQFFEALYESDFRYWLGRWQTSAWVAVLLAATVAGYHYGWPHLLKYQEDHYARQSEQLLADGDANRAMIRCRQVLSLNVSNAIATRILADVTDGYGSPAALYWRQRALLLDPGVTNQIALASTAVRREQFPFPTATKVLGDIAPASQETAPYQLAAGALALKLSKLQEAEQHFIEACKLDPDNPANRMSLAVIHLQSKDQKIIKDSRTTLELLMNNGQVGLLATRSLVAESIDRGDLKRAESLSLQLLKNARSTFSDRLLHLVILKTSNSTNFAPFLHETEEIAKNSAAQAGILTAWLNTSGQARQALDWLKHLPPEFTRQGLLPIAIADAYAGLGQWQEMDTYLQQRNWPGLEHIRFAMMALADARQTGGLQDSIAWQSAVQFAANSPDALNTLARLASAWGWPARSQEVFWFAAQRYPKQLWPLTALGEIYLAQRDTAGMWRVAKATFEMNPNDQQACNDYAMYSLLLNADTASARNHAAALHAADPKNPMFASTYAFSLYKQGRAKEGVKIFQNLPPEQLKNPAMATYYGILLAASGDSVTAKQYLDQSAKAVLLPEEKALVVNAETLK